MFKKTITVMFSGKAGTGKSTSAFLMKALADSDGLSTHKIALADSIKEIAFSMGWDGKKDAKGRKLLQTLGTEVGREYDVDMWCKLTRDALEKAPRYPFDVVLVDDWRFPSELEFFQKQVLYVPVTIRIYAPDKEILKGTPEENHPSEISLPEVTGDSSIYDYYVDNQSTIEDLQHQLEGVWKHINENLEYYYTRGDKK